MATDVVRRPRWLPVSVADFYHEMAEMKKVTWPDADS